MSEAKRRIEERLNGECAGGYGRPRFAADNIRYEIADKARGIGVGGIGAIHELARECGLVEANDRACETEEVVFECNNRRNQENLIAQLAGGVRALCAPVDNLESNWACMVATALAWNLKAWFALLLPERGRRREKRRREKQRVLRMEFRTFVNAFIKIPCQIVRAGRQLIYRVLHYHPRLPVFFRLCDALRC